MTNQTIKIQIDDLVREATAEEIAEIEASQASQAAAQADKEAMATARASALAKLAELGLTADEIAAL
jgi:ribosomal protein L9